MFCSVLSRKQCLRQDRLNHRRRERLPYCSWAYFAATARDHGCNAARPATPSIVGLMSQHPRTSHQTPAAAQSRGWPAHQKAAGATPCRPAQRLRSRSSSACLYQRRAESCPAQDCPQVWQRAPPAKALWPAYPVCLYPTPSLPPYRHEKQWRPSGPARLWYMELASRRCRGWRQEAAHRDCRHERSTLRAGDQSGQPVAARRSFLDPPMRSPAIGPACQSIVPSAVHRRSKPSHEYQRGRHRGRCESTTAQDQRLMPA